MVPFASALASSVPSGLNATPVAPPCGPVPASSGGPTGWPAAGSHSRTVPSASALALLQAGQLFGIYPEGTRSPDGRLYRGRPGVGWLALRSGLPVIPVGMVGTRRVLPPGHLVPRPGRIEVRFGAPLKFGPEITALPPGKARQLIAEQVMTAIRELSGQEYVHMFASDRKAELAAQAGNGRRP